MAGARAFVGVIFVLWSLDLGAQHREVTQLFTNETPVNVTLKYSMRDVAKNKNDTIYAPAILGIKNPDGSVDSLAIAVRARGNFRRANCFFAPLKLKLKKEETKGTLFKGNKTLKLVLPCQTGAAANDLIMKEYLCYKIYEIVTKYTFKTKLTNLVITDRSAGQNKNYPAIGFFIEDDDLAAKRWGGKMIDSTRLNPFMLQDTSSLRHAFFQYMIGNTDWSHRFFHNTKIVNIPPDYFEVAYDFDMCGLVNPQYAVVNEELNIASVKERMYRGYCRNDALTEAVRGEFIRNENAIMNIVDGSAMYLKPRQVEEMKKFLLDFFVTLKNDKKFRDRILLRCRNK